MVTEPSVEAIQGGPELGAENRRGSMSAQQKEQFYQSELIKACVPRDQAIKVAFILASGQPDEEFSREDVRLARQACSQWLEHRQRQEVILRATDKLAMLLCTADTDDSKDSVLASKIDPAF